MPLNLGRNLFQQTQGQTPLQSFNYVDIATGLGYVKYYAMGLNGLSSKIDSASGALAASYSLIDNILNSNGKYSGNQSNSKKGYVYSYLNVGGAVSYAIVMNTSQFNFPRNLNGDVYVTIPLFLDKGNGNASSGAIYNLSLNHIDSNGILTNISTANTLSLNSTAPTTELQNFVIKFPSIKKHIKKNEQIQLAFDIQANTITTTSYFGFCHNPNDDSTLGPAASNTLVNTRMSLLLPFKIDLT